MTIPIPGIPSIATPPAITPMGGIGTAAATTAGAASTGATSSSQGGFLGDLANALQNLQQVQSNANAQAISVAAGTGNIADYMISAEQSTLATQLTTSVADKAAAAFNLIMNMSV